MYTHHRSVTPGAIIGYRKSGMPIRLIAGGSGEGDGDGTSTGQEGAPAGDGSGAPAGDGTGQGDGTGGTGGRGDTGTGQQDDQTARTIAAIREDFKAERAKRQATEKQLADIKAAMEAQTKTNEERNLALAKALGLPVDETPDPEKLAADLKTAREQASAEVAKREARERELLIELATRKQARKNGADPDLLADSRTFMTKAGKLDPASDSFDEDLGDAIKAAVEASPSLKGTPAAPAANQGNGGDGNGPAKPAKSATTAPPARNSGEHNGSNAGPRQWTEEDVNALPKTREGGRLLQEAMDAGLLTDLGYGPSKSRRH